MLWYFSVFHRNNSVNLVYVANSTAGGFCEIRHGNLADRQEVCYNARRNHREDEIALENPTLLHAAVGEQAYRTLAADAQDEFTEKRSRFIGYARPVTTEREALDFIAAIRAKHWDARHNVYAYRLREGQLSRYSDDGEPSGTAGMPVLGVLQKGELTDCAVVVTRYFGGILLGGGGLVRAYSHAAALGVAAAGVVTMRLCLLCRLVCDYGQYGRLQSLIPSCGGTVTGSEFGAAVTLSFSMTRPDYEAFVPRLADATGGSLRAEIVGESFVAGA